MRPSTSLLGASRLPLTPKRGNKDFYKGTRQSYVPGGGHRTGPPGKHVVKGTAKFRLMDERVRYFVGPGAEALQNTNLRPYVSVTIPSRDQTRGIPSFSPNATSIPRRFPSTPGPSSTSDPAPAPTSASDDTSASSPSPQSPAPASPGSSSDARPARPARTMAEYKAFSRRYARAPLAERQALVQQSRREWYAAMVQRFPVPQAAAEPGGAAQ